ncbi:MAG: agmatinase [Thermoplasmata archaeon]
MNSGLSFAGSHSDYSESEFVIMGVPFDKTSSFRAGTNDGPKEIRRSSYCFEPYIMEFAISLQDINIHDFGDLDIGEIDSPEMMGERVTKNTKRISEDKKKLIVIGGEHSVTPYVVESYKKTYPELNVLIIDAHLDYRDTYEGMKRSHATCSRRVSEVVGIENLTVAGVRSMSIEESGEEQIPDYYTSYEILEDSSILEKIVEEPHHPLYLSIDMDGLDPSYAPGVGNPEPFGLSSLDVKKLISQLSDKIVGLDIMETNPKYDTSDITSNLAARLIYEFIGSKKKG